MDATEVTSKKKTKIDKQTARFLCLWLGIVVVFFIGTILIPGVGEKHETVSEMMRDAVLHEDNRISLLGIMDVNPSVISGFIVTIVLLIAAVLIRIFAVPRFKYVPGKLQLVLEQLVGLFDNMAKESSPWRNSFLSVYIFCAGIYIFCGTIFELIGVQAITTQGHSISLPATVADINAAIMVAVVSFTVISFGAIITNGLSGVVDALKEISLLISMSFRLFGALLSGLLVTELVYYYTSLSYILPVIIAVLFTLLHALIQAYVLTMLTSMFYGEKSEPKPKKPKKQRRTKEYMEV